MEKTMFRAFLIKYGEIAIKGKNRYMFEDALVSSMKHALAEVEGTFQVTKEQGRIYVFVTSEYYDYDETVAALQRVFGIVGICPVLLVEDNGFEALCEDVLKHIEEAYPNKNFTFKVNARRARKNYPMQSMEINAEVGGRILAAFPETKVDVHNPQVMINIEIRPQINIYSTEIPGPGGMPLGTAGKAMLLLSGGIDSPVAGYMISKRGVTIEATYFHAPPYTSERAKQSKCLGLITGESIGQVASQTMHSLAATNDVCTLPVYRPCIAMDKQDIVTIAEKIDTYETSILPYEDCCTIFVAKHPVTKPNVEYIRRSETKLAEKIDELMETAITTTETIVVEAE